MSDDITCKVILIGGPGVGKTCIIQRFMNDDFQEDTTSTIGASYASKEIVFKEYNKKVQFDIWDTAGQEQYRTIGKIFYKDSQIAILVFDITNAQSYEEMKNYWYLQIKENAPEDISKKYYNFFSNRNCRE